MFASNQMAKFYCCYDLKSEKLEKKITSRMSNHKRIQ